MPTIRPLARRVALAFGLSAAAFGVQAQTNRISNTATLTYMAPEGERTVSSNTVTLDVAAAARQRGASRLSFRLAPNDLPVGIPEGCIDGPVPLVKSAQVDAAMLAKSPPLSTLDVTLAVIFVMEAPRENHDPNVRETTQVNASLNDDPTLRSIQLTETAPDSGVFAGGLPPASGIAAFATPCDIAFKRGDRLKLTFDGSDASTGSSVTTLVDPAGYVFDSQNGLPVDGGQITLYDEAGNLALIFGVDGVSRYPSTMTVGSTVADASGRIYPAKPGYYRFPLVAPGRYQLRLTPPGGYVAPSIATPASLAGFRSPQGDSYIINDASYLGTFTVTPERDFLADIPIDRIASAPTSPPDAPALLMTKTASVRDAAPGDPVQYVLRVSQRGGGDAGGATIRDVLPPGLRYVRGSARGAAEPTFASDGKTLDFALPRLAAGATVEVRYVATVAPGAPRGEAANRAQVQWRGVTVSNEAVASVRVGAALFTDAMTILGRVTEGECDAPDARRIGVPGIRLLMEDGTFVVTDRDGLYHIEGVTPGRHVVQIDAASIPATHEAIVCPRDTRAAGSATSRFVEGLGGLIERADFRLRRIARTAAAAELPITVADDATAAGNRDWMAGQAPGVEFLFPQVDHNPRAPALRVVVKHKPGQRVALSINGQAADVLAFDATDSDRGAGVAVSRWTGIPLNIGDNRLVARVLDADGGVAATLERTVHRSGSATRATFDAAHSRLVADGLTRPLLAVKVTDATGHPAAAGTLVPFAVDQPYVAAIDVDLQQARRSSAASARVVGDDGLAFLALQPTTRAGAVRALVSLAEDRTVRTSEVRGWLSAAQKEWTIVGFGAGSIGYDMLAKHADGLPRSLRGSTATDGRIAVYAKGRIKGSWLLTMSYDSDRRRDRDRGLLGTIDPDRYYTVYGDGAVQGYDAPTTRKLYLRLERREAYALLGDFETGFTETQLARYSRTLTGVKAAYEGTRLRATGFAAKTDSRYARDELQGNGLSGPYRLSARRIVPNSDKLRIEVRDRFRSERIVSTQDLARHIDYDIDVLMGTVRFRTPVLSRDPSLNPIFIVAEYEVEGTTGQLAAAGRVAAKVGRVEVGASAIRDESIGRATVAAADVRARIGTGTEVRGEFATGGLARLGRDVAYLAEVEHHSAGADLTAYLRAQDLGFGVGQQNLVEAGTRKIGVDGTLRLTPRLSLIGTMWRQDRLAGPGERIAGDARLEYRRDTGTLFVGAQFASDTGLDGGDRRSRLLTLGGAQSLFGDALVLTGQAQFAPDGADSSVDFPARQQVSAALRVAPGVKLIGGYEIANGADYVAQTARVGFDVAPWRGATLSSTLNQQAAGENGQRTYAQYGLAQSLSLGAHWSVDATLDASTTLSGYIDRAHSVSAFQPVATGGYLGQEGSDGAFAAMTLGATYRAERWSWTGRVERRAADATRRLGVTSAWLRTLGEGRTIASSVKAYRIDDRKGNAAVSATADLALAWRPLDSRWSVLERFVLRHERADAGVSDANVLGVPALTGGGQETDRVIQNLAVNYRSERGFEASVYLGAKYVRGKFAAETVDGVIDVIGFDLRHDISSRIDVGLLGSIQHAWRGDAVAFSVGPSIGVSPVTNMWITAGYNFAGYRDRDFEEDRYTRSGPYVALRFKFDERTARGAARTLLGR